MRTENRHLLPYLGIVGLGFLVYARTLGFGFNFLDDNTLILDRQDWLRDPLYLFQAFKEDVFRASRSNQFYYRPVLTASFMLDAQLGGAQAWVYRLTNLLLHVASCCLAFKFLRTLGVAAAAALFFSLVLTVHPIFVQAATLLVARNETLLLLFAVPSFLAFFKFIRTEKPVYYWAHLLTWALALLTRENAILLPLACLSYLYFMRGEILKARLLPLLPSWLVLAALWLWVRAEVLKGAVQIPFGDFVGTFVHNILAAVALIGRIFLPWNLSVYPVLDNINIALGALSLAVLAGLFRFFGCRNKGLALFGLSWFILFLLPVLAKPHISMEALDILEIRIYTASLGLGVLLSTLNLGGRTLKGIAGLVLLVLVVASFQHSGHYRDRVSFWENAAATSPSSAFARNNLGAMYYLDGKLDLAQAQWLKAVQINPSQRLVHGNLGLIYLDRKDYALAEKELKAELALNPEYDHAYFNLGLVYYGLNRIPEALGSWERTLGINPNYTSAYINLIAFQYSDGNLPMARAYWEKARVRGIILPPELGAALRDRPKSLD